MAIEIYSEGDVESVDYARVLLMGPAKSGKTVCAVATAPRPVFVINGDGAGALTSATRHGAKFTAIDANSLGEYKSAVKFIGKEARKGKVGTVVVDTLTLLQRRCKDDLQRQGLEGYDLWRELLDSFSGTTRTLLNSPAHVIVTAHVGKHDVSSGSLGTLPAIEGQFAGQAPGLFADIVWLETSISSKSGEVRRQILVGPQGQWVHACRNADGSHAIDANITTLLETLGIAA